MEAKLDLNVSEAIVAYYDLKHYHKISATNLLSPSNVSLVLLEKLKDFLLASGVEVN